MLKISPMDWGFASGALLIFAADAGHWFIVGHPDASTARTVLVTVQLVLGLVLAIWSWRKGKKLERRGSSQPEAMSGKGPGLQ
jgi:hypothetical protein